MEWKTAFGYLPVNYNTVIGTLENTTQRTYIWNNLDGSFVRVKFSNRYGKDALVIEKAVIGQQKPGQEEITDMIPLLHEGKSRIVIGPGEEFYSDEAKWQIAAGSVMVVSLYFKERVSVQSACSTWSAKSFHTIYGVGGDYTRHSSFAGKESRFLYPFVEADANKADILAGISEIKLFTDKQVKTLALFGDSITHMSYFADALTARIYQKYPHQTAVINCGIGGNRIMRDATYFPQMPGAGKCFGEAGVKRFERDVYTGDCPDYVLLLEGVNDIMHPFAFQHPKEGVTSGELAAGMKDMIDTAHKRGSLVLLGTVMPFLYDEMPSAPDEAQRQEWENIRRGFNEWILSKSKADAVIDFAKYLAHPQKPGYLMDGHHIGDGLHPNAKGGAVMADAVFTDGKGIGI